MVKLSARVRLSAIALLAAVGSLTAPVPAASSALDDYVAAPDASFAWHVHARYRAGETDVLELRLHSQTWRGVLWKHQLYLIRPPVLETPGQGLLIIGGGRWRDAYDQEEPVATLPDGAELFIHIAEQLGSVVAVLGQVPFQPLFGMTEDRIIAYTLERFLETGESDWPLLLPMTKAAIRALDAAQQASASEWSLPIGDFTVLGGSKRGWTTWLAGAVDSRINAIVPVVIDVLNMERHFPYQSEVWGAPSQKILPYTERNLHEILASDDGRELREIVDPYAYRDRLGLSKLVVVASNDEYFPVDSLNLYWKDLDGEKYVLYLPNDVHGIEDYERLIPALNALHRRAAGGDELPRLAWEYRLNEGRLTLCVRSDPAPSAVTVWSADSADRDFRDEVWQAAPVASGSNSYVAELRIPASGFIGVFGEMAFDGGDATYTLSTNLAVIGSDSSPTDNPSLPSHGNACP